MLERVAAIRVLVTGHGGRGFGHAEQAQRRLQLDNSFPCIVSVFDAASVEASGLYLEMPIDH